jgi:predicted nucleic acid-binding protein
MWIAIIDSSCLISLVHLDLASMLTLYFDVVYVPRSVQIECNRKHRSRYRLNKLFEAGVLHRCIYKDETRLRLLTVRLGPGEAEGLVQAQERGAKFFLVDERKAREIGERQGLTLYGMVGLLARFCLEGYAEDIWGLVGKLRAERDFRVADEIVRKAIASAEIPIGRFSDWQDFS